MAGKRFGITLTTACLALTCLACSATMGRPIPIAAAQSIEPGVTTMEDVRETFGEPMGVRLGSDDLTIWEYMHVQARGRAFGSPDVYQSTLQIEFDENGLVRRTLVREGRTPIN